MSSKSISIGEGEQGFDAYVSTPEHANGHAVVVLHEIFGITAHIREVADRFAREGYLAIAPDLFWREERGLSLSHSREDMQRGLALAARYDESLGIQDVGQVVAHAKGVAGSSGEVAVIGMCLGGKLAYLAAVQLEIAAAVAFYGVGIEKDLDQVSEVRCPLLMFFAGKDRFVNKDIQAKVIEGTAANKLVSVDVYEDADHGFYTRGSAETVEESHRQTLDFLAGHLG